MELIYSKVIGEGTPFVIVHGYLGMSDNWKTLATYFSKNGYQMHLLDMRNHGRSFHSDVFNYDVMVEDVVAYCKANQLQKIVLLGHSMGGKVVMKLACKYPEMVEKLIAVDISPRYYAPHHQDVMAALNAVDFSTQPSREEVENTIRKYISEEGVVQFLMKSVYRVTSEQLGFRFNLDAFNKDETTIGEALYEGAVYHGKTLFVRGGDSKYIQQQDEELIKKHFTDVEITTISGAGHWLHADKPQEFYDVVVDFLRK